MVNTEADTRQSTEDFATTASGAARSEAAADDGLSDLEKGALIGLGILAVGALLRNGDEVVTNTGDRVVVRRGENDYYVLKDDDTLLRRPGSTVRTETFNDGSTRTTVLREDGTRIVTIRDASGRVLRRVHEDLNGRQTVLIDDTVTYEPVEIETLPEPSRREVALEGTDPLALRIALERASAANVGRAFSLRQVREIERVRKLVPEIALDTITFETGSAAIQPSEAGELVRLGDLMRALIEDNPAEVFLIEGHTDTVGSAASNLALSDRRAESVALALTEYFEVPPENMVVQGYGESDLKVESEGDIRGNRRVAIRRITPLLDDRLARN
jgi:outer membrane protein OmpA-like peptidoglycan-associated protein